MTDQRSEWLSDIRKLRIQLLQSYAQENFAEGDKLKKLLEQKEQFAVNRGWTLPE